jgi:hypothetical protein
MSTAHVATAHMATPMAVTSIGLVKEGRGNKQAARKSSDCRKIHFHD